MGAFQLFGTVFYFGDVLSYVRLMALGMVTGLFLAGVTYLWVWVMNLARVSALKGAERMSEQMADGGKASADEGIRSIR